MTVEVSELPAAEIGTVTFGSLNSFFKSNEQVLKLWARRYRDLARLRTQVMCRLHAVLCDLVPGGFSREISAGQAIDVLHRLTVHGPVADARPGQQCCGSDPPSSGGCLFKCDPQSPMSLSGRPKPNSGVRAASWMSSTCASSRSGSRSTSRLARTGAVLMF